MMFRMFRAALIVIGAFIVGSCVTPAADRTTEMPAPTAPPVVDTPRAGDDGATANGFAETSLWDLRPTGGSPIFLGAANRLRDREEEREAALLHAAEQASRYVRIAATYRYVARRDNTGIGYLEDIEADWDASLADSLAASGDVIEVYRDEEGTVVLARFPDLPPAPDLAGLAVSSPRSEEPPWTAAPPEIPGFLAAVGSSLRSRRVRESVDNADQEALKGILLQAGTTLRTIDDRRSVEGSGTTSAVTSAQEASAILRQFVVVARFISGDGRYYYSLAIAREE